MAKKKPVKQKKQQRIIRERRSLGRMFIDWLIGFNARATDRYQAFLARRPHRTFSRTYRRDYRRDLDIPGYIALTKYVNKTLRTRWRLYGLLVAFLGVMIFIVGGVVDQSTYNQISDLLKSTAAQPLGNDVGGKLGQAGLLFLGTFASGTNSITSDQQIWLGLIGLLGWLTTVWLLREQLLNRRPRLRDGLYSAGSPIIATFAVVGIMLLQLIPIGLLALAYAGLSSVGLVSDGFGSMLFWTVATVIGLLVLYWITTSILALVIVTLPGMYPSRAFQAAGDLVVGRRSRVVYRLLWAAVVLLLAWVITMIPLVLLSSAIGDAWAPFKQVPLMPIAVALMAGGSIVWSASYVYLLYRRIVEDDARPA